MIKEAIKSLFTKGSFTQDVAIIGGGKVIIAIVGFIFIPFLARIYSPEAYGIFSIYNTTVTILVILFTFSYPSAFVLPEKEKSFYELLILSSVFIVCSSLISLLLIYLLFPFIIKTVHINSNEYLLYFIPAGIFINGFIIILSQLNVRRKNYVLASSVDVSSHILIRLINLIFGLLTKGNVYGLIIGNQIGNVIAYTYNFFRNLRHELIGIKESFSIKQIIITANEYRKYPLLIMPGKLLDLLKIQGSIYFIGAGFGQATLGAYSMSMNLLNIPIQIAGNSVSSVFLKNATEIYHANTSDLPKFTYKIANSLFFISIIPFAVLTTFGKEILVILLGHEWIDSGVYASILSPYFFLLIIFSPLASLFQIYSKENVLFSFNLYTLIFNIISLTIGLISGSAYITMVLFSLSNSIINILLGWKIFKLQKLNFLPFILKIIILFISVSITIFAIKISIFKAFSI